MHLPLEVARAPSAKQAELESLDEWMGSRCLYQDGALASAKTWRLELRADTKRLQRDVESKSGANPEASYTKRALSRDMATRPGNKIDFCSIIEYK